MCLNFNTICLNCSLLGIWKHSVNDEWFISKVEIDYSTHCKGLFFFHFSVIGFGRHPAWAPHRPGHSPALLWLSRTAPCQRWALACSVGAAAVCAAPPRPRPLRLHAAWARAPPRAATPPLALTAPPPSTTDAPQQPARGGGSPSRLLLVPLLRPLPKPEPRSPPPRGPDHAPRQPRPVKASERRLRGNLRADNNLTPSHTLATQHLHYHNCWAKGPGQTQSLLPWYPPPKTDLNRPDQSEMGVWWSRLSPRQLLQLLCQSRCGQ